MASSSPKTRGENSKNIWSFTNNQPKLSTAFITAQVLHVICVVARGAWSSRCSLSGCVVVVGWEVAWQTSTDTGNPHRIFKYCSTLQSQALDIVDGNQKSGINSPVEVVFFLNLSTISGGLGISEPSTNIFLRYRLTVLPRDMCNESQHLIPVERLWTRDMKNTSASLGKPMGTKRRFSGWGRFI